MVSQKSQVLPFTGEVALTGGDVLTASLFKGLKGDDVAVCFSRKLLWKLKEIINYKL